MPLGVIDFHGNNYAFPYSILSKKNMRQYQNVSRIGLYFSNTVLY